MLVPPIITSEHGDIDLHDSVAEAVLKLEAIDVLNGEYVAYDAEGRLLELSARSETDAVEIAADPSGARRPQELATILRDFVRGMGAERIGLTDPRDGNNGPFGQPKPELLPRDGNNGRFGPSKRE